MKRTVAFLAVGCLTVGMMALLGSAQMDKSKRPSPPAKATCDLGGGKTITTDYSSPRLKGRKMIGGVEPYGKVWRNGANEATTFVTTTDVMVGGTHVPAGSYTLFVVPNPDKRSEEHTSELQSHSDLVCRLLLEKKKKQRPTYRSSRSTCTT